ncbi:hypothetical protein [Orientia tsutsugamushi]|uniref:Conjugal transfer protein n=1 Tax=Orientia tsutsugamushi (strain Boryong) TaxID=357244 RepID=A5CE99_ORITB|nr:hypothetical protein [Orientia tsutsugamushi]CAM80377.1 hypothetical protein OTBS_1311 [Orientia tsutsugamushi str. Boryong]
MVRFIFFIAVLVLMLTGATQSKNANITNSFNDIKNINATGFIKKKRFPIYNYKYIRKAQQNVSQHNIDDNDIEDEELTNAAAINRQMYRQMLEMEQQQLGTMRKTKLGKAACYSSKPSKVSKILPNRIIPTRLLDKNQTAQVLQVKEIKASNMNVDCSNLQNKIDELEKELKLVRMQVKNPVAATCSCAQANNVQTDPTENK